VKDVKEGRKKSEGREGMKEEKDGRSVIPFPPNFTQFITQVKVIY
jgi:hypothetical protein